MCIRDRSTCGYSLIRRRLRAGERAPSIEAEGSMKTATEARVIFRKLARQHPNANTELHYSNPFELLVATILSAQTTDVGVNKATPALFARYPDAVALAAADPPELERLVRKTGFFRQKARALIGMAQGPVSYTHLTLPT